MSDVRNIGVIGAPAAGSSTLTSQSVDHRHELAHGVMAVDAEHWSVTYCRRCGEVQHQRKLSNQEAYYR